MKRVFALLIVLGATLRAFAATTNDFGADIFATNAPVLRLKIEIPTAGIRSLERDARKDVLAIVREGNTVYSNVTVHLKGAAGSFRGIHDGPSLTLHFGHTNSDQRFHGLRKIHLNNSVQDRSFTTYRITSDMFNEAGVPAARVTHARFTLNGRDMGFYVLVEGFTKDFLKYHFKDGKGNFYDGGFCKEITENLEKESGDDRKDNPDLMALAATANIPDRGVRWATLQKKLDVDRFLSYMALETLTTDWDGYMAKANNYRVYHDPTTDKIVFIPHGMDQMFERTGESIYHPQFGGLVARALMDTPEGARLFHERVKEVFAKNFRLETITNRYDFLVKRNREAVAELGRGALAEFDANTRGVRNRIVSRWNSVAEQIENEPKPLDFSKPVHITRWRQQIFGGNAEMEEVQADGKAALRIAANGRVSASWRSAVSLEQGTYRFEALAKCSKISAVQGERGEGAGLRISGSERHNKMVGDMPWTRLQFDFTVNEPSREVQLVCESIASRGEVVFDKTSLKLIKLK